MLRRKNRNMFLVGAALLTWPLNFIWVPQVFWCRHKHFGIGDRRPERDHVKPPVMPDRSILLRIHYLTCMTAKNIYLPILLKTTAVNWCTWLVPPQPFIKDGICKGVQQHKDGVIWWEVSLSTCPIEKKMGQVVEAADHRVIHPLWCTVA